MSCLCNVMIDYDILSLFVIPQVSAFSTWEKELPKFVFDDRFHLLLPKDRKVAFDEFIATRAEQEMKEKKQKMKEKRETFVTLLKESKISKKYEMTYIGTSI